MPKLDGNEDTQTTLKKTAQFWLTLFGNEPLADWQNATSIAVTMTDIKSSTLNLNVISPALMKEALNRATAERLKRQQTAHEQVKKEPVVGVTTPYAAKLILRWMLAKMQAKKEFTKFKPTDEEIEAYLAENNLDSKDVGTRVLAKIYLNDCKEAAATGVPLRYKAYKTDNGQLFFKAV